MSCFSKQVRFGVLLLFLWGGLAPKSAHAMFNTTAMPLSDEGSGSTMDTTTTIFLGALAANVVLPFANWLKETVSEKDFARNVGYKVGEFFLGVRNFFHKQSAIDQMLSDQMTKDMSRILTSAMKHGLKKQPLDGDEKNKFVPGYFVGENADFFAWQNLFLSSLKEGEMANGLLIFIPAEEGDSVSSAELRPLSDRENIHLEWSLTAAILDQILPAKKDQEPVLEHSLKKLKRWFMTSGILRSSIYLGYDQELGERKKVKEGIKLLRILNPLNEVDKNIQLLGSLLFMPDLPEDKVDLTVPLLIKPEGKSDREWQKLLPKRVRWFFKKKDTFFTRGANHASIREFLGPIVNQDPEGEREKIREEQRLQRQIEEEAQNRIELEQRLEQQRLQEQVMQEERRLRETVETLNRLKQDHEQRRVSLQYARERTRGISGRLSQEPAKAGVQVVYPRERSAVHQDVSSAISVRAPRSLRRPSSNSPEHVARAFSFEEADVEEDLNAFSNQSSSSVDMEAKPVHVVLDASLEASPVHHSMALSRSPSPVLMQAVSNSQESVYELEEAPSLVVGAHEPDSLSETHLSQQQERAAPYSAQESALYYARQEHMELEALRQRQEYEQELEEERYLQQQILRTEAEIDQRQRSLGSLRQQREAQWRQSSLFPLAPSRLQTTRRALQRIPTQGATSYSEDEDSDTEDEEGFNDVGEWDSPLMGQLPPADGSRPETLLDVHEFLSSYDQEPRARGMVSHGAQTQVPEEGRALGQRHVVIPMGDSEDEVEEDGLVTIV